MSDKERVLVIAYACEPGKTSEPGVGWNFVKEIAKYYEITVVTRTNNRVAIEKDNFKDASFRYYDLPKWFIQLKKKIPLGTQVYYFFWQWAVYLKWNKENEKQPQKYSLLHHLNFGITWITPPAFIFKVPFVWGPIGGGDLVPFQFLKKMQLKAIVQETIYAALNGMVKLSIFSFLTKKKSSAIIFRNESVKDNFLGSDDAKGEVISETATSLLKRAEKKEIKKELRAICVGRMEYWKGFLLAVQGFHSFLENGGKGTLEIFGDGPEKESIQQYIAVHNLQNEISIRGFVKNNVVLEQMKQAHVLIHPSFRDGGSWAIMEAMSNGLPVVCLNASGPKDMVTTNCGLLIETGSHEQVKADIGTGLFELMNNKEKYKQLSANAILRIHEEYNWHKRGEQLREVYDRVLEKELINE